MSETQAVLLSQTGKLTREQLALVATPAGTATHRPVPHADVVTALVDTLALRHIAPVREEYAVSKDGTKMFGIVEIETTFQGCRFAIGIRNAHDKSMRLAMTVGYRVTAKLIIYQAFIEAERIFRNTSPGRCISCISIRSTRSSRRARCGVFRTRSPRR
jgi:hypothetical protein